MQPRIKQYYGIKFPFTNNNFDGHFIDLNQSLESKVASQIAHLLLTRKGTRLRMPDFGTNLTTYIFDQNDGLTWSNVEGEIRECVAKYIPNTTINKVVVTSGNNGEDNSIMVDVQYTVSNGKNKEGYRMALKL